MTDLDVRLQPRARKDEIAGERDGRIVIRGARRVSAITRFRKFS
jgi:hypothetical protein